jgi:transmembrane 9 superfamily member 2/4
MDYYSLPVCKPAGGAVVDHENLGELLQGDRIQSSPYVLKMKEDMYCEQLCVTNLGRAERRGKVNRVVRAIRHQYHNNWIVDNLSAASKVEDDTTKTTRYWQGFPIGFVAEQDMLSYIHNHVNIEIMYHAVENEINKYRVVRVMVEPFSIAHDFETLMSESDDDKVPITAAKDDEDTTPSALASNTTLTKWATIKNPIQSCVPGERVHTNYDMVTRTERLPQLASGQVLFTYDVKWEENKELQWASRWDIYLSIDDAVPDKVHLLSIANSLVIVCVLSAMTVAILLRNLRQDLARYNQLVTDEEKADNLEERGWKLVHGDVFRPPSNILLLSVCCGTGAQLLCMAFLTIIFSAIGFLSPDMRGELLMVELVLFVLMGVFAGFVTARVYKTLKGKAWQNATLCTALGFPGVCFTLFFLMDIMAWTKHSTDAVPFAAMVILLVLWFGISTPLVFLGAYFGYKQDAIEFPVKTSSVPRQIPDQPWFRGYFFTLVIAGILPFGSCFVELYFILASMWMSYYYDVFGFLFLVFVIVIVTCAEITLLFTYFQLCNEDYHWWWHSFGTAGSTSIYVFLYSMVYFKRLEAISVTCYILYFGYMGLSCVALFLMTGFVGFTSSFFFNKAIFGSLKVD